MEFFALFRSPIVLLQLNPDKERDQCRLTREQKPDFKEKKYCNLCQFYFWEAKGSWVKNASIPYFYYYCTELMTSTFTFEDKVFKYGEK